MTSTQELISQYDNMIAGRWNRCELGSTRAASRQRKIDAVVNEI